MVQLAFDATSSGLVLPGTSVTFAHTCTGSNLILLVGITSNNADVVTGVTYAGVAMTLDKKSTFTGPTMYFWRLLAPATGANNVVVTASASSYIRCVSVSYTNAQQSGQPDATAQAGPTTVTSLTTTLTQVVATAWQIGLIQGAGGSVTAGTGVGAIRNDPFTGLCVVGDSNADTVAGSESLTWNTASGTDAALQYSLVDLTQIKKVGGAFWPFMDI